MHLSFQKQIGADAAELQNNLQFGGFSPESPPEVRGQSSQISSP